MSDNSDKTVPADADDYKDDEKANDANNIRRVEHNPLVEEAKSEPGEIPNRDEDEFTGTGKKAPDVEKQAEEEAEEVSDNR